MMKKAEDFDAKTVFQPTLQRRTSSQALQLPLPIDTEKQVPQSIVIPAIAPRGLSPTPRGLLPDDFEPSSYCILCGKGRDCYNAVGNRRLRLLVDMNLERYSLASRKSAKSFIVSEIVDSIHAGQGKFVKKQKGKWVEISDAAAREKVGALFRDSLHFQYKSSGKAKTARRRLEKQRGVLPRSQSVSPPSTKKMVQCEDFQRTLPRNNSTDCTPMDYTESEEPLPLSSFDDEPLPVKFFLGSRQQSRTYSSYHATNRSPAPAAPMETVLLSSESCGIGGDEYVLGELLVDEYPETDGRIVRTFRLGEKSSTSDFSVTKKAAI